MSNIIVYTLPNCVQCDSTKRFLDKHDIQYNVTNLEEKPEIAKMFIEKGYKTAPIVVYIDGKNTDIWSGFKIDNLKKLVENVL